LLDFRSSGKKRADDGADLRDASLPSVTKAQKGAAMKRSAIVLAWIAFAGLSTSVEASPWYAEAAVGFTETGNIALGYEFRPNFGIEAGFRRTSKGYDVPIADGEWHHVGDVDGLEVALRGAVPLSPRFALTGRFGFHEWETEYPVFNAGSGQDFTYSLGKRSDVSAIVGAGLRAELTEHLDFTAEYTASQAEFSSGTVNVGLRAGF
jgi:hypothetical protein